MKLLVMKFLIFPVTILGDIASLEGSARSLTYPTKFSASMSKVANCGVCAHACTKATAQKAAVRMRFHLLVVIFMVEMSLSLPSDALPPGPASKAATKDAKPMA